MARRKVGKVGKRPAAKKRKTSTRRRRRISGVGKMDLQGIAMKIAGVGAGAVVAREMNTVLTKMVTISPEIMGLMQIAGGVVLPMVFDGPFMQAMGDGMIAQGVLVELVDGFKIISGSPKMMYTVSGGTNLTAIGSQPRVRRINGGTNLTAIGRANVLQNPANKTTF